MNEDELESILDDIGGFNKESEKPPIVFIPKEQPIVNKSLAKKTLDKKANKKGLTNKVAPKIVAPTIQTNRAAESEVTEGTTEEQTTTFKKRQRKTKQDLLQEKAKLYHGELMGDIYTSSRSRKILLQLNKLIYADMKIYQILEFLLLQSLEHNKELLPPNYMDLIE